MNDSNPAIPQKQQERALNLKARQLRLQPAGRLVFPSGAAFEILPNGRLKRIAPWEEPQAQL